MFENVGSDEGLRNPNARRLMSSDLRGRRQLNDTGVGARVGTEMGAVTIRITRSGIEKDSTVPVIVARRGLFFDRMNHLQRGLESERQHGWQEQARDLSGMISLRHQCPKYIRVPGVEEVSTR
jgi:hypothetical protein